MTEYLKAIVPLAAAIVVCLVDKLLADDSIPDAVWLTLLGVAVPVWTVPNKPKAD